MFLPPPRPQAYVRARAIKLGQAISELSRRGGSGKVPKTQRDWPLEG